MDMKDILNNAKHCILGSGNRKLTIIMKSGDKIVITGKETVLAMYEYINGK